MKILFLNHKIESCGVYQYGLRLYNILKRSSTNLYYYTEIDSYNEYISNINLINPNVIIYNYHSSTMPWLNNKTIQKNVKNIGIPHESEHLLFDIILSIDPDETETNNIFNIPRPIFENVDDIVKNYKINNNEIEDFIGYNEGSDIPIFGSFGFGFQNKGFDKIITIINSQYDSAIIKLIITYAYFDPYKDKNINSVLQLCNSISLKPNIKLMISHKFLTNEEILLFLKSNTCNIFLYDKMQGRGISSVIDYAISVKKPFIISDSYMFRNVYSDDICVYKTNIKTAIENSNKLLPYFLNKYSNEKLIKKVDMLFKFNNITDNNTQICKQINEDTIKNMLFGYKMTAYYYIDNYYEPSNVTDTVFILFNNFIQNKQYNFKVGNDIFLDTCVNKVKTLFINLTDNKNNTISFTCIEQCTFNWMHIIKELNNIISKENQLSNTNLIETSIGEIIDKYCILELKNKYIKDNNKLNEIQKEIKVLDQKVSQVKQTHFYKLLLFINDQIWIDTDNIKKITNLNENNKDLYIDLSRSIFENNQKRFRLKNYFNILQNSNIKEHKSYSTDTCYIHISENEEIYDKIPEINYLCISYDIIYFNITYKETISKLFKNPNIMFISEDKYNAQIIFHLLDYKINTNIRDIFEFNTIKYLSGGKLGDFLNQLSVVCEKFYETGQKGELYIAEIGDYFSFGLQRTYDDTYSIISSQKYIKKYQIYNNEAIDINLSLWRNNIPSYILDLNYNLHNIYSCEYNIPWGKHNWICLNNDLKLNVPQWNNKIIINITPYRFMSTNALNIFKEKISGELDNCVFISNEREHYDYFRVNTNINIDYYQPKNFEDMVTIINSCKLGFFGFSSASVIANALHKQNYIIGIKNNDFVMNNLKQTFPFILDILV